MKSLDIKKREPLTEALVFRATKGEHKAIKQIAKNNKISMSEVVRAIIKQYLEDKNGK